MIVVWEKNAPCFALLGWTACIINRTRRPSSQCLISCQSILKPNMNTADYILHTALCTLLEAHCTLNTAQFTLHTVHFTLHTEHYTLHTSHYTLHTSHYTLSTAHWKLHTAHCTLHTAYYTLHTTHCTLHTAHLTPRPAMASSITVLLLGLTSCDSLLILTSVLMFGQFSVYCAVGWL